MARPNIIFILIDDMGWKDLGCCGSPFYETPRLDRLAAEGMRFTNAYAACPVCSPTRASVMTGRYPARVGVTDFIGGRSRGRVISPDYTRCLPLEEYSLAKALRAGGYATWHVGKWHLGDAPYYPEHHGFDVNIGGCHWGMPSKGYFSPWQIPVLPDAASGTYLTDYLTDRAVELVEKSDGQPFFLNLWHYAVHIPIQAPAPLVRKYEEKARDLSLDKLQTFAEGEFFPSEHKRDKRVIRRLVQSSPEYAAMVENLDWNIGRLLDAVAAAGQADNTIVVFTSDNGGLATAEGAPTCNAPLAQGKGWMYEGGTREPLIVKWPGVTQPGALCGEVTTTPDFYPTLLDAAGLSPIPAQHCDGVSLAPLLRGAERLDREAIFWHYPHYGNQGGTPGCSLRRGDHKLIEFFEDDHRELYNLREDEGETRNLAADEPRLTAELAERLAEWRADVGARLPTPNPDWKP